MSYRKHVYDPPATPILRADALDDDLQQETPGTPAMQYPLRWNERAGGSQSRTEPQAGARPNAVRARRGSRWPEKLRGPECLAERAPGTGL